MCSQRGFGLRSEALFFMAAAWCDVGLQPTWQEIELASSLLALLFMAARCEDGCAANVAGATRVRAISSLCFYWLAPRVPARPTWSWSRSRELLDFVYHGRHSRSSQRGRRIEPLGTLLASSFLATRHRIAANVAQGIEPSGSPLALFRMAASALAYEANVVGD